ncbi:MAG: PilZ domain-containing protein [Pseudomonadota bacterium]
MTGQQRPPRYSVERFNIVYDTGEGFWCGPVIDVSEGGLFVETTHELPVGTVVTIVPDTPDQGALPFEIRAEVVRVHQLDLDAHADRTPGLAFRWQGLNAEQIGQFRAFITSHGTDKR